MNNKSTTLKHIFNAFLYLVILIILFSTMFILVSVLEVTLFGGYSYEYEQILLLLKIGVSALLAFFVMSKVVKRVKIVEEHSLNQGSSPEKTSNSKGSVFLGLIVVLSGILVGFIIGAGIAFGACFKQDCSALEGSAPIWSPLISLLVTVPVVRKMSIKKKSKGSEKKS